MKIRIQKNILLEALQLILSISPKATSLQAIGNLLIETDANQVIIKATNFEVTFLGSFPAIIEKEGKACIQTAKLHNLARNFIASEVVIEATKQNWVLLQNGNTSLKLPGIDPDAFPPIEFKQLEQNFVLPSEELKLAIDRTLFAIGENESRKNLMGLNLEVIEPKSIRWMGADAFRIAQAITDLESEITAKGNIIIPKKSLNEVKRILDYAQGPIQLSFDENTFQIEAGKIYFKTRLIEADYPNLERILTAMGATEVEVPKGELTRAVRILNTLYDGDPNAVMKLTFMQDQIIVESQKLENGEGVDRIYCPYAGEEISIGLNIQFVLEALQVFESASEETILFNFSGSVQPFFIRTHAWPQFKTVLMPVKIKW